MTRVLLVTGSRSLAKHPGAEAWARDLIREALEGVNLLIVGDAEGPDRWAWAEVSRRSIRADQWCASGPSAGLVVTIPRGWRHWTRGNTHPLARNAAMVRDAASMIEHGAAVRCLALFDGTKRDAPGRRATRGTEHTAGLAERAGLTVQREVWNG